MDLEIDGSFFLAKLILHASPSFGGRVLSHLLLINTLQNLGKLLLHQNHIILVRLNILGGFLCYFRQMCQFLGEGVHFLTQLFVLCLGLQILGLKVLLLLQLLLVHDTVLVAVRTS